MAFLGEIRIFTGNFAPQPGWMLCQGQLLSISMNQSLFNLIGAVYGGDGTTTFALPDLQGRAPVHVDPGNGFNPGIKGGTETVNLVSNNLPAHTHPVSGPVYMPALGENPGTELQPENHYPAITGGQQVYSTDKQSSYRLPVQITPTNTASAGGGQAINTMQPFLVINFIISITGDIPVPAAI